MLRLATVGTSPIAEKFLAATRLTGRFRLTACYSRSEDKAKAFAAAQGFTKTYTDLQAMAADPEVDAVYIATPNVFHCPQSRIFLEAGKHVICEKPIATCAAEYRQLLALAEEKGVIYMEAIVSRHCLWHDTVHEALGQIGNITQARFDYCQKSSRYDDVMAGKQVNIFDMSLYAGTLMDLGIYCVWAALDLLGMPQDIKASAAYLPNGSDSAGTAIFSYPGFLATLTYSKLGKSAAGTEIIGDKGVLRIGSISKYTNVCLVKNGEETQLLDTPDRATVLQGEAEHFADYITRFSENEGAYRRLCQLTEQVHVCMDAIKASADIRYPEA